MKNLLIIAVLSLLLTACGVSESSDSQGKNQSITVQTTSETTAEANVETSTESSSDNSTDNSSETTAETTSEAATEIAVENQVVSDQVLDVSKNNSPKIIKGGTYTVTGSGSEVNVQVETNEAVTLVLDNLTASNSTQPVLELDGSGVATIEVIGTNTLTMTASTEKKGVIDAKGDVVIQGDGKLTLTASVGHGVKSETNIYVNSSEVLVSAGNNGLKSEGNVEINGGQVSVEKADEGIEVGNKYVQNAGNVLIYATDDAINAQIILDESTRLTNIIKDVLDVSKIRSSLDTLTLEFDYLYDSVKEVADSVSNLVKKDGYKIEITGDRFIAEFDKFKIKQAVYNLITNAINYGGDDKKVKLNILKKDGKNNIEVIDHGQGIDPKDIDNIFDRYYKVETKGSTHNRGIISNGIGLNIVKNIMTAHKGFASVKCENGATIFRLEF